MNKELFEKLIELAIKEDIGEGDHSSIACIPENHKGEAKLFVKQEGIIAGIEIAKVIFKKFDPQSKVISYLKDGEKVKTGDIGFLVECNTQKLLQVERLVLNIMQRMSGIASETAKYTTILKPYKTKILDTRKTTPGFRIFEKEAVKIGGGENHRMGLYDMIMLKDNHIDFSGGIENAIKTTQAYLKRKGKDIKIEIEARNINDIKKILSIGGVDRIMLDNFSIENTKKAVELINGEIEIESSGGINIKNIESYAKCNVDYISVGAMIHQAQSMDLSLKAV